MYLYICNISSTSQKTLYGQGCSRNTFVFNLVTHSYFCCLVKTGAITMGNGFQVPVLDSEALEI